MKRIEADGRARAALGDRTGDPLGHVAGHQLDELAALLSEQVQELLDRLAVAARGRPHQAAGVVVDDDGRVSLALANRDLIEPQAPKAVQSVARAALSVGHHALTDPADRPPRGAHQRRDGARRRVDRKPCGLILKRPGERRVMTRPRNRGDDHSVAPAFHARRLGFDVGLDRTKVQGAPAPSAIAPVIAWAATPADRAAPALPGPRPGRDDDRAVGVEEHVLDHGARQSQQSRPYPYPAHVASPPLVGSCPQKPEP